MTGPVARPIVLVTNPGSGSARSKLQRARVAMHRAGIAVEETVEMENLERLQEWIRKPVEERPVVAVAGGDGTVGSVARYLVDTGTVMGILPTGTSNDVARSLGIPMDMTAAVQILVTGRRKRIDVGRFVAEGTEPQVFVHAAAMGVDVAFARFATSPTFRRRLGPLKYAAAGILALRHAEPFECTIEYEDQSIPLHLLHLSLINAPIFGGAFGLSVPGSKLDDRKLDVLAVDFGSYHRLLWHVIRMLAKRPWTGGGVHLFHTHSLRIHTPHPTQVSLDGEVSGEIPGEFQLAAESLLVLVPPQD